MMLHYFAARRGLRCATKSFKPAKAARLCSQNSKGPGKICQRRTKDFKQPKPTSISNEASPQTDEMEGGRGAGSPGGEVPVVRP